MTQPSQPDPRHVVQSDPKLLLPSVRIRVEAMIVVLRNEGQNPKLFETGRSPERAIWLGTTGKSRNGVGSLHCLGAAADLIDAEHGWDNPAFFVALGRVAALYGMTWGGDWDANPDTKQTFDDRPHVQGVPVPMQNALRACRTFEARERFVAAYLQAHPMPTLAV